MKVRLLDYTGKGQKDPADYAAKLLIYVKNTRLTQGAETQERVNAFTPEEIRKELAAIANTIRSSWEFIHYTWEVTGVTRAMTHQFVRSRHLSFAQQAMRIVDMRGFDYSVPSTVDDDGPRRDLWDRCMEIINDTYTQLIEEGVPAQDARGVLPTNVLTNIIASANLRAFADLVGKRDNPRVQDEYVGVVRQMAELIIDVHPWTEIFLYPPRKDTPELDTILREKLNGRPPVEVPEVNEALKQVDRLKATWG